MCYATAERRARRARPTTQNAELETRRNHYFSKPWKIIIEYFPSLGKTVILPFQGLERRGIMAEEKATLASFQQEVGRLVEQFTRNLAHYSEKGYDEACLRKEFLNPFFRALGWGQQSRGLPV